MNAMLIGRDGHILEPPDLWERHLEPRYRARALPIRVDKGHEYLVIDGKRATLPRQGNSALSAEWDSASTRPEEATR
jgi:hypothetical protein